jgi:hypothetical protein
LSCCSGAHPFERKNWYDELKRTYPGAYIFGRSTAGEIRGTKVSDGLLVSTAVKFDYSRLQSAHVAIPKIQDSFDAGEHLGRSLNPKGLVHGLVLSEKRHE